MRRLLKLVGLGKWESLEWQYRVQGMVMLLPFLLAAILLCLALWMGGCVPTERQSTLQQEQRENVGQKALADFTSSVKPQSLRLEIPQKEGPPVILETPVPSETKAKTEVSEKSKSEASGMWEWSESIPLFVKMIGLAVACFMFAGLVWFVIRNSRAAKAAWEWTNDALVGQINTIREMKGRETDPARIAALSEEEARLERLRAEANK